MTVTKKNGKKKLPLQINGQKFKKRPRNGQETAEKRSKIANNEHFVRALSGGVASTSRALSRVFGSTLYVSQIVMMMMKDIGIILIEQWTLLPEQLL